MIELKWGNDYNQSSQKQDWMRASNASIQGYWAEGSGGCQETLLRSLDLSRSQLQHPASPRRSVVVMQIYFKTVSISSAKEWRSRRIEQVEDNDK